MVNRRGGHFKVLGSPTTAGGFIVMSLKPVHLVMQQKKEKRVYMAPSQITPYLNDTPHRELLFTIATHILHRAGTILSCEVTKAPEPPSCDVRVKFLHFLRGQRVMTTSCEVIVVSGRSLSQKRAPVSIVNRAHSEDSYDPEA